MLYKRVLKSLFFRFDPEAVHDFMTYVGATLGATSLTRLLVDLAYGYHGPNISKVVDGIKYRTPFMLSAGFDYNGRLFRILPCIGLGGEEIGSLTAKPCKGNPRPRLTRLPQSKSILVNKGLKNDGVDAIIERIKNTQSKMGKSELGKTEFVKGISIARTNCQDSASVEAGIDDYAYSFRRLNEENIGDYYSINISCPNAFGGEAFTTPELLTRLLSVLKQVPCTKPIYVKMPINIPWAQFDALLKVIDMHDLSGVIIGNLNKDYDSLTVRSEAPQVYRGGLSGKPCTHLSTDLIAKTREMYGRRFTIIGVGGVMSPATALEKFEAGADLVQLITGLIFEGPGLVRKMCVDYGQRS